MPGKQRVERIGSRGSYPSKVISYIRDQKLIDRGCLVYLAFIYDIITEPPFMDSIPLVYEFPNVFSTALSGVPLDRDIDFTIDLELGN